ncbi:MAG: hypothetical protein AB2777_16100 [Candidatus Thiodiazotropha endolucinida]
MKVRQATIQDLDSLVRLEAETWPEGMRATRDMIRSRIETYPKGVYVIESDGEIFGVVAYQLVNYNPQEHNITWNRATDNGMIKRTHNPDGDSAFGVNLSVVPHAPAGAATKLLVEVGRKIVGSNLRRVVLGSRIPYYHKHSETMKPVEYVFKKIRGRVPMDPELRFYSRFGFMIEKIVEGYIQDKQSMNFAVIVVWDNPLYARWRFVFTLLSKTGVIDFLYESHVRSLLGKETD